MIVAGDQPISHFFLQVDRAILETYHIPISHVLVKPLARRGEEVRLLHTRPNRIGRGAGTQLIEAAKRSGVNALELWCFQANARARRFYEARGFHAIGFTDGAGNEERTPDVHYRWEHGAGR